MLTPEDRAEISNLLAAYNLAVDTNDPEGWAATFTEEGIFESGPAQIKGREELVRFVRENRILGARHWLTNVLLEGNDQAATIRAYLFMGRWENGNYKVFVTGSYADSLTRAGGAWKFTHRIFTPDPTD